MKTINDTIPIMAYTNCIKYFREPYKDGFTRIYKLTGCEKKWQSIPEYDMRCDIKDEFHSKLFTQLAHLDITIESEDLFSYYINDYDKIRKNFNISCDERYIASDEEFERIVSIYLKMVHIFDNAWKICKNDEEKLRYSIRHKDGKTLISIYHRRKNKYYLLNIRDERFIIYIEDVNQHQIDLITSAAKIFGTFKGITEIGG